MYISGGTGNCSAPLTANITLDKMVVNAPVSSSVTEPPGWVFYGFEFTMKGLCGSIGIPIANAFLSEGPQDGNSYSSQEISPSDMKATPEQFTDDTPISPGTARTGWVGFAFPPGVRPGFVSFELGSLTIASLDTSQANPMWYLNASMRPSPTPSASHQPVCTQQDPSECLLADSAVAGLDAGTPEDAPSGMTKLSDDVDASQGFAAEAFKDSHGNIIIADEDADLASPFSTDPTPYQNESFLAEAEIIDGKSPYGLLNDATAFADKVQTADTDAAPIYLTGFGLGGVEAQEQSLQLGIHTGNLVAGGVTFGSPGLPGNSLTGAAVDRAPFVNFVDYGDSLGDWSADPGGPLVSLAPDLMDHFGTVVHTGDELNQALPLLAKNTSNLTGGGLIATLLGSDWHTGDGFDQALRLIPDPAAPIVFFYTKALKAASYAYLAGSAVLFHSIKQYASDLNVSLSPTVAAPISQAEFTKLYQPSDSTADLQAANATTVTAAGTVTGPGYGVTADPSTGMVASQTYTATDDSQYDVSYDPSEQVSTLKVNDPGGAGSYVITNDDSGQNPWSTRVDFYSGAGQAGTLTETLYNWTAGGSQLQVFTKLPKGKTAEIINYSQPDATGDVLNRHFR